MYRRLYNVIAKIIRKLSSIIEEVPEIVERYRSLHRGKVRKRLKKYFPALFKAESDTVRELRGDTGVDENMIQKLEAFVDEGFADRNEEGFLLFELLCCLDKGLQKRIESEIEAFGSFETVCALNDNYLETEIALLPYLPAAWERSSRRGQHFNDINSLLRTFYYIDQRDLKKMKVKNIKHIFLNFLPFERAKDLRRLRIGFSPLSRTLKLDVLSEVREEVAYFSVDSTGIGKRVKELVLKVLDKAKKAEVDIVFFPEMVGSPEVVDGIAEYLQDYFMENNEEYPFLIVLPSVWENHKNYAVVLSRDGEVICRQEKQYSYEGPTAPGGERQVEDINPDHTVYLLHCRGLGRIAIMICKDFLMTEYLQMVLQVLKGTLILVPCMSTGEYDFKTQANACEYSDCCVMQGNCCSAEYMVKADDQDKLNTIGYVLKSGKNQNPRYTNRPSRGIAPIIRPEECREGNCQEACLFCGDFYFVP